MHPLDNSEMSSDAEIPTRVRKRAPENGEEFRPASCLVLFLRPEANRAWMASYSIN